MTSHAEILHAHLPRKVYWKSHTARANLELLCLFPVLFLFVALSCFLLALFQQLWPIQLASFAIQCTLVCPEFCWKSRALRKHLELLCSVSYVVSSRCSAVVFVVHAIHTAETKCRSTFQIRSVKRLLMSKLLLLQNPNADACASAHLRLYHQFAKWRCSCTSSTYTNNLLLVLLFWRPRGPLKVLKVQPYLLASSRFPRGPHAFKCKLHLWCS